MRSDSKGDWGARKSRLGYSRHGHDGRGFKVRELLDLYRLSNPYTCSTQGTLASKDQLMVMKKQAITLHRGDLDGYLSLHELA